LRIVGPDAKEGCLMLTLYVAGPYSADTEAQQLAHVRAAEVAALECMRRGWAVICPHTMTNGWEHAGGLTYADFLAMDLELLSRCDALLYLAASPGADKELRRAEACGLRVFRDLGEVSDLHAVPTSDVASDCWAFDEWADQLPAFPVELRRACLERLHEGAQLYGRRLFEEWPLSRVEAARREELADAVNYTFAVARREGRDPSIAEQCQVALLAQVWEEWLD
jgi:hypothetical protein